MRTWSAGRWLILTLHLALPTLALAELAVSPERGNPVEVLAPSVVFALYGYGVALAPPDDFFGRWRMLGWVVAAIVIDVMAGTMLMAWLGGLFGTGHRSFGGFAFAWLLCGGPASAIIWAGAWGSGFVRRRRTA